MPEPQHQQQQVEEEEHSRLSIDLQYSVKALGSLLQPVALCMVLAALLVAYVQVDAQSRREIGFKYDDPEHQDVIHIVFIITMT